jgi:hypothetical protein
MRVARSFAGSLIVAASVAALGDTPLRAQEAPAAETAAAGPAFGPAVEASLDSMQGHRTLSVERGRRVVVLFYEDRAHVEDNDALKGELRRFVVDNQLGERVVTYGVANLADVGMVPEALVRSMIAPAVERWGSDILLDWQGVMRRAPFSFQTDAANVAIVDLEGHIVWRHTGPVDETRRRDFYRALRRAMR